MILIAILRNYDIAMVVDVRTIARSRHNPQYNEDELAKHLRSNDIGYVHSMVLVECPIV